MIPKKFDASEYTRSDLAAEQHGDSRILSEKLPLSSISTLMLTRQEDGSGTFYITLEFGRITELGTEELDTLVKILRNQLSDMAQKALGKAPDSHTKILVVGLGNGELTADAIGPNSVLRVTATRHLKAFKSDIFFALGCCELACITPGVLGKTGIESAETVMAAAKMIQPHLILAVDALAARSPQRLASTIQLSDGGIAPGSGIGNTRVAIDSSTMGCPVIAIGIPTVVDSSTLVYDALHKAGIADSDIGDGLREVLENGKSFIVSPKEADLITEVTSRVISDAVNRAFGVPES
ncbi:MAG: GPR endopeptidase [Ruminococcaceae bacterium]|nr:GPR endopeptidase [Oscillospiraceae bacterium]